MQDLANNNELSVIPEDIEFLACVGKGGYAEVWMGCWNGKGGGTVVAIKKIQVTAVSPKKQKEIYTEVDILSKLRHPSIVQIFGVCFTKRELWVVLEYMDGGSMFDLLSSELPLGWDIRIRLAQQAAMGVNVLHSCTPYILHRDIKSLNFLVSSDCKTVKLIDFGMSKIYSVASAVVSSVHKEAIGTTRWGAPETFNNPPQWTPRADIYSLGITFYEIATRKIPFEEVEDNQRLIYHVCVTKYRPEIPADCPQDFADIIRCCWDVDANERPSCAQLLAMLKPLVVKYTALENETVFNNPVPSTTTTTTTTTTAHYSSKQLSQTTTALSVSDPSPIFVSDSTLPTRSHSIQHISDPAVSANKSNSPLHSMPETRQTQSSPTLHTSVLSNSPTLKPDPPTSPSDIVSTAAGLGLWSILFSNTKLQGPAGICMSPQGESVFMCEWSTDSIKKLNNKGNISAVAENITGPRGIAYYNKDNSVFVTRNAGITKITINYLVKSTFIEKNTSVKNPVGITINQKTGDLFVCDNDVIYTITQDKQLIILAGGDYEIADGAEKFRNLTGICFDDASQSLFVCDSANNKIRRVTLNGTVSTVCNIESPKWITCTLNGTLLITSGKHQVFKAIKQESGEYTASLLAGNGKKENKNGTAAKCSFDAPAGIAVAEASHACYVAESEAIRKISFS